MSHYCQCFVKDFSSYYQELQFSKEKKKEQKKEREKILSHIGKPHNTCFQARYM